MSGPSLPPIANALTLVLHALTFAVSLSIAAMQWNGTLFSYHPVLMSLGYLLFITEAVVSAINFRHLVGEDRVKAIYSHMLFCSAPAMLCIIGGFYAVYQNKVNNGYPHFKSTHAQVGLVTLLLTMGAPLGGAVSFRKLGLLDLLPASMRPVVKLAHRNAGTAVWLLSLVTVELTLTHKAIQKELYTPLWQAGVAAIGVLGLVLMLVAQPQSKKAAAAKAQ